MRRAGPLLLFAARYLAMLAALAGLATGCLASTFATLICFDSCPTRDAYFSRLLPGALTLLAPCAALATLALVLFLAYCFATRQSRRAIIALQYFLAGGLVAVAALATLAQIGKSTLPIYAEGVLVEGSAVGWAQMWGLALIVVAVAWSGILAYLIQRPPKEPPRKVSDVEAAPSPQRSSSLSAPPRSLSDASSSMGREPSPESTFCVRAPRLFRAYYR